VTECYAMSIGGRSQSARTYLEKHLDEFATCLLLFQKLSKLLFLSHTRSAHSTRTSCSARHDTSGRRFDGQGWGLLQFRHMDTLCRTRPSRMSVLANR
jgi:hypothetical protein